MGFLSPDSAFMRGLSDTIDAIWINILMVVTSIPIVTIGAAVTAGYDASRRTLRGEGRVTANYCRAFARNFLQSTLLWLPFLVVGAGLAWAWVALRITPLLVPKIAFTLLWVIGFEWVFALQARFANTPARTFANAYVFGVTKFGYTLAMAAIDAVLLALFAACWTAMPQGLFLLALLGYGAALMLHVPIFERAMRCYL